MAPIRMSHPDHGYDSAYDNAAVKRMKESGWKTVSEAEWQAILEAKKAPKVAAVDADDEPEAPVRAKPGPKPKAK